MNLERIEHTLSSNDNLLRLFFDGKRSNESGDFFGSLPLRKLSKTLLTSPDGGVNNLDERLSSSRIENENRSIDRLGRQISFERLVDRHSVNLSIIDEPNTRKRHHESAMISDKVNRGVHLVREELRVVL